MNDERPVYDAEQAAAIEMIEFRPMRTIWATKIEGPFAVKQADDLLVECEDGFLVFGPDDDVPMAIPTAEFNDTYEPLFSDDPEGEEAELRNGAVGTPDPVDEAAVEQVAVGNLPVDAPALTTQIAHRTTYLELVVTGLIRELEDSGHLPTGYVDRAMQSADRALAGSHRARATTTGRSGLIALELVPAK